MATIYALLLSITLLFPCPLPVKSTAAALDTVRSQSVTEPAEDVFLTKAFAESVRSAAIPKDTPDENPGDDTPAAFDIWYLLRLQEFRSSINDAWTPFMEFVSKFATRYLILFAMFVYWAMDKRKGLYVISSMCLTLAINQLVKLTACVYRPWIRDTRIVPAGDSIKTATGYSFPSGHTATAAPQLGGHAINAGKKYWWVGLICMFVLLTIAFSRNYLGVHTPQDVCVAILESALCLFIMWKIFAYLDEHPEKEDLFLLSGVIFGFVSIAYITFKPYPMTYVDGKLLVDPQVMMNDGYGDLAFIIAFCIGRFIEKKWIRFKPAGIDLKGIILCAVGMIIFVLINDNIGAPLDRMLGSHWGHFFRRMITILYYMALYPAVIKLVMKSSAEEEPDAPAE